MSAYWVSAGVLFADDPLAKAKSNTEGRDIQEHRYRKLWFIVSGGGVVILEQNTAIIQTVIETTKILESFPEGWKYKTHQLTTSLCADGISMNTIRHFGIKLLFCWLSEHRQVGKNGFIKPLVLAEHWLLLGIPLHKNEQVLRNLCLPFIYGEPVSPMPRQRETWICSE